MTDAMTQNGTVNGNAPVQPGAAGEVAGSGTDASVSEVVPMCQPMPISELPIDQPLHQEEDEEPIGLLGEMLKAEASPAAAATAAAQAAQAAAVHDDLGIPAEAGLEEEAMKMVGGSALASPRDDGRAAVMERGSGGRGCKRRRQSQYSRFRGVTMNKKGKYVAQLWTGERMCYLGAHDTGEEAAEAYDQAVRAYGLVSEKELNFPLPEEDGVQQALTQMPSRRHQQLRGSKAGGWRDDGDGDLGNGLAGDARLQAAAAQLDEPPLEMAPPWTTLPEEGAPLYVGAPIGPLQVAARDDGYHDLLARHPPPPPPLLPKLTLPPPEPQLQQPMLMQQQQQQQRQAQGLFGDAMLAGGMAAGPGYHGVSWVRGKFQAHILWQGRHVFIGRYSDEVEAARAYDQKVLQVTAGAVTPYTLNFPEEAMRAQPAAGAALPPATADIHNPAAAAGVWPGMFHPGLQGHL